MANSVNLKDYFYTETEVDTLLNNKADTNHTHSQYLTEHQSLANYLTSPQINTLLSSYALSNSLAAVATSGSYNDLSNKPSIPTKVSDLDNDTGFITNATIENLGGVVSVEKQSTAETGYVATYIVKQGGEAVGAKINIPKDFLVKSASIGTVTTANNPEQGFAVGDKYLDFVINTRDNSGTDEHLYLNVNDLINEYTADETTLTLSNGVFSIKSGVVPQANSTATNIKMNGTQSAGSATTYAKADHIHPTDTSRAAASHSHGNVTNDGKVGTTANKPLITGTGGLIQAGSFGTTANTFAEGNHTHSQYLTEHQDVSDKLEFADLDDMIGLSYDSTTGILSLTFTNN